MGVQTRSSTSSSPVKPKTSNKILLPSAEEEPYKIFVLPSNTSEDARFVLLRNPHDGARRRFFFCPNQGLFEITKISPTTLDYRSILLAPEFTEKEAASDGNDGPDTLQASIDGDSSTMQTGLKDKSFRGHVSRSSELFVATPFDPVFILLPMLDQQTSNSRADPGKTLFQPFDDLLDEQLEDDKHLRHVLTNSMFRSELLKAMDRICDSVDAGDEKMYRLSLQKLYEYILTKAHRVVDVGLPASLEDRFVTRALEVPMLSVKREETVVSVEAENNEGGAGSFTPGSSESQSTATSTVTSVAVSEVSSVTSVGMVEQTPSAMLYHLQRLRTAFSFITASYLHPSLTARLTDMSGRSEASPDFGPLDEHLSHIAKLRAEALATRSVSDFARKRQFDDDETAEDRAEKKRKQEEEDKKKKSQESRGVRDLKRVNVSGMKKMSDFFAKKPLKSKPKS